MEQALYGSLARYYDLIYSSKDYEKESLRVKALISRYKKSDGNDLLDVACGTGRHLKYPRDDFVCMGVDKSREILEVAKKNVDSVAFKEADMIAMDLGRKFDVITCLFSSIGYVKTNSNLDRTIRNFARHLRKGGVVLIEPWFTKLTYHTGSLHMNVYDGNDIKIVRLNVSQLKGSISVMEMHYLIAEKDNSVKHFIDRHELGLFEVDETLRAMKTAGLISRFLRRGLMKGRGMFVGVKEAETERLLS